MLLQRAYSEVRSRRAAVDQNILGIQKGAFVMMSASSYSSRSWNGMSSTRNGFPQFFGRIGISVAVPHAPFILYKTYI